MGWIVMIMEDIVAFVEDGLATWDQLFYFKFWDVKQNLILNMRQIVFAYVIVKGCAVDLYVYSFFISLMT